MDDFTKIRVPTLVISVTDDRLDTAPTVQFVSPAAPRSAQYHVWDEPISQPTGSL
jgi:hypothetical protein